MHQGTFPSIAATSARLQGPLQGHWPGRDLDGASSGARRSRREWLFACFGAIAGVAVAVPTSVLVWRQEARPRASIAGRGTLAWALALRSATDADLIESAGDLERVTMRHPNEARLVPILDRLFDAAARSSHELRDAACCCALRSLAALERLDLIEIREARVLRSRDLPESRGVITDILSRHRRGR